MTLATHPAPGAGAAPSEQRALLEIRDLHVTFQRRGRAPLHAVQGIDLSIQARERFALVGESGCGKSTSILAMMGLLPVNAEVRGSIRVDGVEMLACDEHERRAHRWTDVAMVFQSAMNSLNPVQPLLRQIVEPMIAHEFLDGRAARARARELLGLVGIPERRADSYPHELSGGMRQRAALAMALSCDPKVLIADEPTTALDTMVQAQIFQLLRRLTEELGVAVVLVTHDLPVVMDFCDRAAVMYAGVIAECASVRELYAQPRHPYTRLLLAASPDIERPEQIHPIPGVPPQLDKPVVGCRFRERCDVAMARCAEREPPLALVGVAHEAACWRNDPQTEGAPS
jgi:oligopeptide/dipeptide ABC transporter ATP-binding protein